MKVAIYNEKEDVLRDPILGRPFSFNQDKWEYTESLSEADWIFGHLHYLDCNLYYDWIAKNKTFKKYASKFVFWAMHDTPTFAYQDTQSLKFICQPLQKMDINFQHNIVAVPLQMRHYELALIQDEEWIKKVRETPKEYDFMYIGQTGYQGREFLRDLKLPNYYLEETQPIWHVQDVEARVKMNKEFCEKLAKAKYVFCPRGEGSSSFRLFQSLMVGSVPIVSGQEELPFNNFVNWEDFAKFDTNYEAMIEDQDYNNIRTRGIDFWDNYVHMEKCDRFIFQHYLER